MIEVSDVARDVLTGSYIPYLSVESWYGGDLVASDVPIITASEDGDRSLTVRDRVTFTVPRLDRGTDWSPTSDPGHPLAANGQRLHVKLGVGLAGDVVEYFGRGWFLIQESAVNGDQIDVTGVSLISLLQEARLVSPYQPTGTLATALRGLVEPAITVAISSALVDRAVPSGIVFDDDRLGCVGELLDAWAADATMSEDGTLSVFPAGDDPDDPVFTLSAGSGGTLIRASGSSSREGAFNAVIARGTDSAGGNVQALAYDQTSPRAFGTPFNPLLVPFEYFSPLLTTVAQCQAAAGTVLARKMRQLTARYTVECVPDPTLQLGDVGTVDTGDVSVVCVIEALSLPYTGDASMVLTVRSLT